MPSDARHRAKVPTRRITTWKIRRLSRKSNYECYGWALTFALSVAPYANPVVGEDEMMLTRLREVLINNYLAHGLPFVFPQRCQRKSGWESLDDVLSPIFSYQSLYETHGYEVSIARQCKEIKQPYVKQDKGQSPNLFAFQAIADILKTTVKVLVANILFMDTKKQC